MVDRDPVTEPAGDMVAAQKLVEVLSWIDNGGEENFYMLAEALLGWKGKRLRDAIADTGVVHLGKRQTDITPATPPDFLSRLARAAGLVLSGVNLESFIRSWLEMAPGDLNFRQTRLRALGGLVHILARRREQDLTAVSLMLLQSRDELPDYDPPQHKNAGQNIRRIDIDATLAEHIYRQANRAPQAAAVTRQWFVRHGDYDDTNKHRVAREAAVRGHWDLLKAFFASGNPYGKPPRTARRLPPGAQKGDLRSKLSDYIVERMAAEAPEELDALAHVIARHVAGQTGDVHAMLEWLIALTRYARQHGGASLQLVRHLDRFKMAIVALKNAPEDKTRAAALTLSEMTQDLWP